MSLLNSISQNSQLPENSCDYEEQACIAAYTLHLCWQTKSANFLQTAMDASDYASTRSRQLRRVINSASVTFAVLSVR